MKKTILLSCLLSFLVCGYAFPPETVDGGSASEEQLTEEYEITIRMVGDDLIHSPLYEQSLRSDGSYCFDQLFAHVKEDIEAADIAIINQETILIYDRSKISSYPSFGTPAEIGHSIVSAGFDVVAHATNHTMDKGIAGIEDTIDFWETNYPGIQYLGIHKDPSDSDIRYVTKNHITVGFVNYTYGLNGLESRRRGREYIVDMLSDSDIEATLGEARQNCDLLVAVLHVGDEYVYTPTPYERQQVNRFIDNGADIVLCAHPHVLEPYGCVTTEQGNTGLVYYSLGNFVSSQNRLPRVLGGMADIRIRKTARLRDSSTEVVSYDLIPLVTHEEHRGYTTYRLDSYPDELAARHALVRDGFSKEALWALYNQIMQ